MDKRRLMDQLIAEARVQADACAPGTNLVWGEGDLDSLLMIVGEAPGEQEDLAGRPFVGASGKLLDAELALAGISREHTYITGSVKCRPMIVRDGRVSNRAPTSREIELWRDLLLRQIEVVSPKLILCLGSVAASNLIHPGFKLIEERGKWFDGPMGIQAMATFHPAYILRWKRLPDSVEHQQFRADLRAVAEAADPRLSQPG